MKISWSAPILLLSAVSKSNKFMTCFSFAIVEFKIITLKLCLPITAGSGTGPVFEGMIKIRRIFVAQFRCNFFYRYIR